MSQAKNYAVNAGWRVILGDLGINPANVLKRAGLPDDLFKREAETLDTNQYFALWRALEEEAQDEALAVKIGQVFTAEAFDPPIFAALCSPNLNVALQRIARYKALIGPMVLHVRKRPDGTQIELEWLDKTQDPPLSLVSMELVFFVRLARIATRTEVKPLRVTTPTPPSPGKVFTDFFGVPVQRDKAHSVVFSPIDATLPFLTANDKMWNFFEPELRKRLSELDQEATTTDRVRASLLELLPSGTSSMEAVAKKLALSKRTLQRKLKAENVSFQAVLNETRESLASHYLKHSAMSGSEISFLLGFEDPNSFIRAFHSWTGQTPEVARATLRA